MDIYEVGIHELSEYVTAFQMLPILKAKRAEKFNSFYHDCTSSYLDDSLGYMRKVTFSVEEAAIWIIEKKQEYDNLIHRYERKSKVLTNALLTLEPEEQDIFLIHFLNSSSTILQKICKSLNEQQSIYFKQKRLKQIKEYISA